MKLIACDSKFEILRLVLRPYVSLGFGPQRGRSQYGSDLWVTAVWPITGELVVFCHSEGASNDGGE
jgi:hypothetical protein